MRAAIYARKSTEQTGICDEEKSVTRQIEHAKAYARKKGWIVLDEHVYVDDGISGAEFVKRPGFIRLMNTLKPKPQFQFLVMSEESRLGREAIETSYVLKQIIDAGVRLFFYLEDRERTLDNAMDKVMLSLANFASEMEREKARQRTHEAMLRKAKARHVTGGRVYGYDNVDVLSEMSGADGKQKRQYVRREVNPTEAAVVRRIYELYASGLGLSLIAKALNAECVPCARHGKYGWGPSGIREILHRELYRGVIVWNRTQKIQRAGTRSQRRRPPSEWVRLEAPDLQIIPTDLWSTVNSRLEDAKRMYLRNTKGQLLTRPSGEKMISKYLLSGLAKCGVCGGSVVAMTRNNGRHRRKLYGCVSHHKRGTAICSNGLQIEQDRLDQAVLHAIADMLNEDMLQAAVERALTQLRAGQERDVRRKSEIECELSQVETHISNMVEAIKRARATESLLAGLESEEIRKKVLLDELPRLGELEKGQSLETNQVANELSARFRAVKTLLGRHIPQSREMLKKILHGKFVCQPFQANDVRGYRFYASGTYGRLLCGEHVANDGRNPLGTPALTRSLQNPVTPA
jgi:site-specific DNA recombinase